MIKIDSQKKKKKHTLPYNFPHHIQDTVFYFKTNIRNKATDIYARDKGPLDDKGGGGLGKVEIWTLTRGISSKYEIISFSS